MGSIQSWRCNLSRRPRDRSVSCLDLHDIRSRHGLGGSWVARVINSKIRDVERSAAYAGTDCSGRLCARVTRSGSYSSPVIQSRCKRTASFRATATSARFLEFLSPSEVRERPHRRKSQSGPFGPRM